MSLRLGIENEAQFLQCVGGPVRDGDLISKDARDRLVDNGLLARGHGYNILTADGVLLAIGLRMLCPGVEGKEWLTAHDDRHCPWCAAMDEKIVKVSEPIWHPVRDTGEEGS